MPLDSFTAWDELSISGRIFVILLAVWILLWKGMALWKAAGRKEKTWFVILLVVNTFGLLEILYIYLFSRDKEKKENEEKDEEKDKKQGEVGDDRS